MDETKGDKLNIRINCTICEADLSGEELPKACPRCKEPKPLMEHVLRHVKQNKCEHQYRIGNLINYTQFFICVHCGAIKTVNVESTYNYDYVRDIDWDDVEPTFVEDADYEE